MHMGKAWFNAVVWKQAIYLCMNTVEVYEPENNVMRLAGVVLPDAGNAVSFVDEEELVVITINFMTVVSSDMKVRSHPLKHYYELLSNTPPVVFASSAFCTNKGKCLRYLSHPPKHPS